MSKNMPLLVGFFCLLTSSLFAQTPACQPDNQYRDSSAGVYPLPFVAVTRPNGGITAPACVTKPYSFVWTVKVNDTITAPNPLGGGTIDVPADSVRIASSGAIQGLPTGITYACNPPNCVWKKRTMGCVIISGTPPATNTIKTYPLTIAGKAYFGGVFGTLFPSGYDITFPGAIAPGSYDLRLLAANDPACARIATKDLTEVSSLSAMPNPTSGKTIIRIEASVNETFEFSLTDLLGRKIITRPLSIQVGENVFEFDTAQLPNGVYIYALSKGSRISSNKLIVNH